MEDFHIEKERRSAERIEVALKAIIAPMDYRSDEAIICECMNLSELGCFISTRNKFLLGDRIQLEIELSPEVRVSLNSKVIGIRQVQQGKGQPFGVGVQFMPEQEAEIGLVKKFIQLKLNES